MSFSRLRRSRLLAGLLLAASPAGAGTVLPVVHPCPVDMPWFAPAHGSPLGMHAHGHHGTGRPAPDGSTSHRCNCISSCVGAAMPGRSPEPASVAVPAPFAALARRVDARLALAPIATLLPPATAPPAV